MRTSTSLASARLSAALGILFAIVGGGLWLPVALAAGPQLASDGRQVYYEFLPDDQRRNPVQSVVLRNSGDAPLTLTGLAIVDDPAEADNDAGNFSLSPAPALPRELGPGQSLAVPVAFDPATIGPKAALLRASASGLPALDTPLRGLAIASRGGSGEPSLQWIFETLQIPLATGDGNPADNGLGRSHLAWGDEILAQRFVKAGSGPVTVEPLAAFGPGTSPMTTLGWYVADGGAVSKQQLFSVPQSQAQSLLPAVSGTTSFDPGGQPFALYSDWPQFANQGGTFGEFSRNTWEPDIDERHKLRVYPLRNPDGSAVANAYIVATEETTGQDYQDVVVVLRNVRPAPLDQVLEFNRSYPGTLVDKDNQPLGFPTVQRNSKDTLANINTDENSYDSTKLDLDTGAGVLRVLSTRTSSAQNNYENLKNALELPFVGDTQPFTISARLRGPLTQLTTNSEQAGIFFGPSENNFIKVIAAQLGGNDVIELYSETNDSGSSLKVNLPSPATLETLDLYLIADPASGQVRAAYRAVTANGDTGVVLLRESGGSVRVLTLTGARKASFFNGSSRAGLTFSAREESDQGQPEFVYDRFALTFAQGPATPTPTNTATATATNTATATATNTATATSTATNTATATATSTATNTATNTATATSTATNTATNTATATVTGTRTATPTGSPTSTATNTATATRTATSTATRTATATSSPTVSPTPGSAPQPRIYLPLLGK